MSFYKKLFKKVKKAFRKGAFTAHPEFTVEEQAAAKKAYKMVEKIGVPVMGMGITGKGTSLATKGLKSAAKKISRSGKVLIKGKLTWETPSSLSQVLKESIQSQIKKGIDPRGGGSLFRPELRREYTRLLRKILKK